MVNEEDAPILGGEERQFFRSDEQRETFLRSMGFSHEDGDPDAYMYRHRIPGLRDIFRRTIQQVMNEPGSQN